MKLPCLLKYGCEHVGKIFESSCKATDVITTCKNNG